MNFVVFIYLFVNLENIKFLLTRTIDCFNFFVPGNFLLINFTKILNNFNYKTVQTVVLYLFFINLKKSCNKLTMVMRHGTRKFMRSKANADSQNMTGLTPVSLCSRAAPSLRSFTMRVAKEALRNDKPNTKLNATRKPVSVLRKITFDCKRVFVLSYVI